MEEALIELYLAGISVRKNCNLIKLATLQKVVAIDDDGGGVTIRTETGDNHKGAALSTATGCGPPYARTSSATARRSCRGTSSIAPCCRDPSGRRSISAER